MEHIKEIINDSRTIKDVDYDEELSDIIISNIENIQLRKFYQNNLNFSEYNLLELIEVMNFLDNKYFYEALYLASYYNYNLFFKEKFIQNIYNAMPKSINNYYNYFNNNYNHIIKYFISNNIFTNKNIIFERACEYNNSEIIKYLISTEKVVGEIDIHYNNESPFRCIFEANNLEMVKYLISLEETHGKINIHADNEYVFLSACSGDDFEIVKYLISLEETHGKINIHEENEFVFLQMCSKNNLEMIKYLISLEKTHGKIDFLSTLDYYFINMLYECNINTIIYIFSILPNEDSLYQKIANLINNTDLLDVLHECNISNKKIPVLILHEKIYNKLNRNIDYRIYRSRNVY